MSQQGMRDALTYTPGDGYVYRWDGGPWIKIYRITTNAAGTRVEVEQPDVIAAPDADHRTGTQLCATVDVWRGARA